MPPWNNHHKITGTTSICFSGVCSSAEGWPGSAGPLCFKQGIQLGWASTSMWPGLCLVCSTCNLSGAQAEGAETTRRKLFLRHIAEVQAGKRMNPASVPCLGGIGQLARKACGRVQGQGVGKPSLAQSTSGSGTVALLRKGRGPREGRRIGPHMSIHPRELALGDYSRLDQQRNIC